MPESYMESTERMHCVFYRDVFGGWRWKWRDSQDNERQSQHSYDTKRLCVQSARRAGAWCTNDTSSQPRTFLSVHPDAAFQNFLRQTFSTDSVVVARTARE